MYGSVEQAFVGRDEPKNGCEGGYVPRRSSAFSQSSVQISAGLTDISGLAVAAFDLINCSLSVPRLVFVFDVSQ